ncbi:SDR family oxidoreductase [Saccharopolyspora sp. K220]|uniref:SDR family oxidoreductase n=1 Tax=Saccharopolyspora soli TaxID=2926618 RepID=UPI001F588124|nr:SDR family oxidoreductase [Saccharopolyspora soli]MCI2422526.1 SDR family oxidoreductase [Saccharopolyspora soli]
MGDSERVAIVTGGSRRIGRKTALRLVHKGYAVVVNCAVDKVEVDAAVAALRQAGGQAIGLQADVADETAVTGLFDQAEAEFGGVDVVVHAAGILPEGPSADLDVADLDLAVLDRLTHTNLRDTSVVDRQAERRLRPGGAIINVSSSITRSAHTSRSAHTATKGGVVANTLILARELRGSDITVVLARELRGGDTTVHAVPTGPTATTVLLDRKTEVANVIAESPLERLDQPADIAEIVSFLAGPDRWTNFQAADTNGGNS